MWNSIRKRGSDRCLSIDSRGELGTSQCSSNMRSNANWDTSGMDYNRHHMIRNQANNDICLNIGNNGRIVADDCKDSMPFVLDNRGNLRTGTSARGVAAEDDHIYNPVGQEFDVTPYADGCVGLDNYDNPVLDGSGRNTGNMESRECSDKWDIHFTKVPKGRGATDIYDHTSGGWVCKDRYFGKSCEHKGCNVDIDLPDKATTNCDYNTGNWICKDGFSGDNCEIATCDVESKPANESGTYCDQDSAEWTCKTGWFGPDCDVYCPNDVCLKDPSKAHDMFFQACVKGTYPEMKDMCNEKHSQVEWKPNDLEIWDIDNLDLIMQQEAALVHQRNMHDLEMRGLTARDKLRKQYSKSAQNRLNQRRNIEDRMNMSESDFYKARANVNTRMRGEMDQIAQKYDFESKEPELYKKMVTNHRILVPIEQGNNSKERQIAQLRAEKQALQEKRDMWKEYINTDAIIAQRNEAKKNQTIIEKFGMKWNQFFRKIDRASHKQSDRYISEH